MVVFLLLVQLGSSACDLNSTNSGQIESNLRSIAFGSVCDNHVYHLMELNNSILCSRSELKSYDIANINAVISDFSNIYPKFISEKGYNWSEFESKIIIIIISNHEMNSHFFGDFDESNPTTARYFPYSKIMYLKKEALSDYGFDLPHELSHVANAELGIKSENLDENLAYMFENYYAQHAKR